MPRQSCPWEEVSQDRIVFSWNNPLQGGLDPLKSEVNVPETLLPQWAPP